MYDEAWRVGRDWFYDENMHGLDWEMLGARYKALLPWVAHRSDLDFLLSELVRRQSVYSLPEAVHRITQASADVIGLRDRGSLKEGWIADLNVIDYDALETGYPYYVNDFPHNGGRYIVESRGYLATIVAGQVVVENGKHTGNRPGRVIREFARG